MTNKGNGNGKEPDFVDKIFVRKSRDVPLIKKSKEFYNRTIEEQAHYWHKLASSNNAVAVQIQKERDELNVVLFQKEAQLVELKKARSNDQMMIHQQLAKFNEEKQKLLLENQSLLKEIKVLEEKVSGN